jgi:ribosomal protein L14E/L6E/L27E
MKGKSVVNITVGTPVKAHAGRDKGSYFVAVGIHDGFAYIADGRTRKLEKPKRKNVKHISPVGAPINIGGLTNKKLRRLINEYLTHTDLRQTQSL